MAKTALLILALAAIALVAGYYYFFQSPSDQPPFSPENSSFEGGFQELASLFEQTGIPRLSRLENLDQVVSLDLTAFSDLKSELQAFRSNATEAKYGDSSQALKELAEVYMLEVDYYAAVKESSEAEQAPVPEDPCDSLSLLNNGSTKLRALSNAATVLSNQVSGFIEDYPAEAETASLDASVLDPDALEELYDTRVALLQNIEEGCAMPHCDAGLCESDSLGVELPEGLTECPPDEVACDE